MLRATLRGNVLRVEGALGDGTEAIVFHDAEQADEAMRRLGLWAGKPLSVVACGDVDSIVRENADLRAKVERLEVFEQVCMKLLTGELKPAAAREMLVRLWAAAVGATDVEGREHLASALREIVEASS